MVKTILVVDDARFMREMLKDIISQKYEVVGEAEDGEEAVEKVKKLNPDLVTLDVIMPGKNGFEALAEIKSLDDPPYVIMSTSIDQNEKIRIAKKIGADGYITKPFKEKRVLENLEKLETEEKVRKKEEEEEPSEEFEDPLKALDELEEEIEKEL